MFRGRAHPCSTSFPVYFSKSAALRLVLADLWFPCSIIADRLDFLVASFIGDRWYWEPFWTMSIIFSLSSWWWNSLDIPMGPGTLIHNSCVFPAGIPRLCAVFCWRHPWCCRCVPLLLFSIWRITLGGRNYFDVVLMSYFTVVAIHNVFDSCWKYRLPFSGFSISYPLYTAYLWLYIFWSCSVFLGVFSLGVLRFSEEKLGGFGVVLDFDFFVLPFCIDF